MEADVDEDDMVKSLESALPSERANAASWFIENARSRHRVALANALSRESVPQIRALLSQASHTADRNNSPSFERSKSEDTSLTTAEAILDNLATMIRHELEPAIGWIRLAADSEIDNFEDSQTNSAVEALRRRISSLVSLVLSQRGPKREYLSITNLIYQCLPYNLDSQSVTVRVEAGKDDSLYTDKGLLSIILLNAFQNCADALAGQEVTERRVDVEFSTSDEAFWLTVRNRFDGSAFSVDEVTASGITTKLGHKGIGLSMMFAAAKKLAYDLNIQGEGGVATLSLRGATSG
jgi:C4-dicarboxylate-specific signal transduction histidine kinase